MLTSFYYSENHNNITFTLIRVNVYEALSFFSENSNILVKSFFGEEFLGYNGKSTQYILQDIKQIKTVKELKEFIRNHKDIFIQSFEASIESIDLNVSDDYTTTFIFYRKDMEDELIKKILLAKNFNVSLAQIIKENQNQHIIVDSNSNIVKKISDFDEYIEYGRNNSF